MYALAIFDRETRCLTLARDRAGEKPLYYAATDSLFAFASELRPLLEIADLPVALSEEALAQYFTFRYVPEPDSMLAPIRKLRSEEHTSELQSLMRISYAVFCLTKK